MMENLNKFQQAVKKYGVSDLDVFQSVDLVERRNIPQVTQCIMALGRSVRYDIWFWNKIINFFFFWKCYLHPDFRGPYLGPKPAEENKREWSEEQLRAGETVINLQYGTNKGANASGMNFGNTRHM